MAHFVLSSNLITLLLSPSSTIANACMRMPCNSLVIAKLSAPKAQNLQDGITVLGQLILILLALYCRYYYKHDITFLVEPA